MATDDLYTIMVTAIKNRGSSEPTVYTITAQSTIQMSDRWTSKRLTADEVRHSFSGSNFQSSLIEKALIEEGATEFGGYMPGTRMTAHGFELPDMGLTPDLLPQPGVSRLP